jgi:hypothetical protein
MSPRENRLVGPAGTGDNQTTSISSEDSLVPKSTAEQVIVEILRLAGGELSGKTRLSKAFYFAHLAYYDQNPGELTNWPMSRTPNGPGIDQAEKLFDDLVSRGLLETELMHDDFFPDYRYRLTAKAAECEAPRDDVRAAVQRAVDFVRDRSCSELSQLTREYSRSWSMAQDGELLNIYLDLIPDDEYRRREADLAILDKQLESIFAKQTEGSGEIRVEPFPESVLGGAASQ